MVPTTGVVSKKTRTSTPRASVPAATGNGATSKEEGKNKAQGSKSSENQAPQNKQVNQVPEVKAPSFKEKVASKFSRRLIVVAAVVGLLVASGVLLFKYQIFVIMWCTQVYERLSVLTLQDLQSEVSKAQNLATIALSTALSTGLAWCKIALSTATIALSTGLSWCKSAVQTISKLPWEQMRENIAEKIATLPWEQMRETIAEKITMLPWEEIAMLPWETIGRAAAIASVVGGTGYGAKRFISKRRAA